MGLRGMLELPEKQLLFIEKKYKKLEKEMAVHELEHAKATSDVDERLKDLLNIQLVHVDALIDGILRLLAILMPLAIGFFALAQEGVVHSNDSLYILIIVMLVLILFLLALYWRRRNLVTAYEDLAHERSAVLLGRLDKKRDGINAKLRILEKFLGSIKDLN